MAKHEVVTEVLRKGNENCSHSNYNLQPSFENYCGQVRVCACGFVETCPAAGEMVQFADMGGEYILQEDGSAGPGFDGRI
jgi:hypothetical protein